jgi:very-short-patch-repair endonuclease
MDQTQLKDSATSAGLKIDATLIAKLNLADFQNAVPLIRDLWLINETDQAHEQVELLLTSDPPFLKPRCWRIDALAARSRYPIHDLALNVDGGMLARLTEAETATVSLALRTRGADTATPALAQRDTLLELLPRNQWGGLSHLPDLVAAFVQPNDPAVDRLLKRAAEVLHQNDRNPALDGYTGGAKRAWELTSAIWGATAGMQLDYALPPASFEQSGQKVRSPSQIEGSGIGTCFDLALLFCAALEQVGLNSLMVFTEGHAFAGVWLQPEEFSTVVVDDVTSLRKRLMLKELVLFETTLVTQRPTVPFSYATERGAQQVDESQDAGFRLAVDIRRARLQRIKPLASAEAAVTAESDTEAPSSAPSVPKIEDAPDFLDSTPTNEDDAGQLDPKDRLLRWQRKLLDLSLRNNLLNFKNGKKALKLDAPDPGALEDLLANGQALKLRPRPDLMNGTDPRDQAIYEARERENVRHAHALEALQKCEVFVNVPETELDSRLTELFRGARTTLQEGGANTLYLALGFLSWTREDREGQRFRAPLILVPVSLQRKSARSGFTLILHDDEPRFNPTLIEMLRQDFDLSLGTLEGELPRDDSGLDVAAIWKTVGRIIKEIKGWEVTEDVVLSMFSFAKYLMWKDLAERSEQLRENPVVRHLLDTPRDAYPLGVPFPQARELDQRFDPKQVFCPLPADSSQLSAVLAASQGKDFVLIGPPGTGKSQTIANLIAQSLAQGRRVLFVSQKIAALDVVYRRLREIGLGEFCLELHSSKTRKLDVLAQLQAAWSSSGQVDAEQWRAEADKLKRLRDALNIYVERLHQRRHNGLSLFDAIGTVSAGQDVPTLAVSWPSADQHDRAGIEQLRNAADRLEINAQAIGHAELTQHSLALVGQGNWSPTWQQQLIAAARDLLPAAQATIESANAFAQAIGLPSPTLTPRTCEALLILAQCLPSAAGHDWRFVLRPDARSLSHRLQEGAALVRRHAELNTQLSAPWPTSTVIACTEGLAALAERRQLHAQLSQPWAPHTVRQLNQGLDLLTQIAQHRLALSVPYDESIEKLDVAELQQMWEQAEQALWPKSWLEKRKVTARLSSAIRGGSQPDVTHDLQHWNAIRALRKQLQAATPAQEYASVWEGLDTNEDKVRTTLRWQTSLAAVREGQPWEDDGFEAIADGQCGATLQADLQKARRLRQLDQDIAAHASLEMTTDGLWAGHATQVDRLSAALDFLSDRREHPLQGSLDAPHSLVEEGACGPTLARDHQMLRQRAEAELALAALDDLRESTAGLWKDLTTNLDDLAQACQLREDLTTVLAHLATTPEQISACKAPLHALLGDANALLEPGGQIALAGARYAEKWNQLLPRREALATIGCFAGDARTQWQSMPLDSLIEQGQAIVRSEHSLRSWCAWRQARDEALALGLGMLVQGIEQGQIGPGESRRTFETNYARWWLNAVVDHEPVIRGFVSAEHEQRIRDFRELDERFTALTRNWLRARLCADIPSQDNVSRNSEWGLLRHEIGKKRAHLPLRELMTKIPEALTKLTPCLLMSPLSIAQYLHAGANAFDLVIFDEASQIPVWDAIGAIARGRQVVMVGDPKQLPPTSFFDRAESGLDDADVEADLESILDECIGANLPTRNLNWHYRSRHESLIAFSNHAYYNGELVTFPSPVTNDRAVSLQLVSGAYQKGGARTNPSEAKALVTDVVAHLTAPGFHESGLTIGIVTFNAEQQKLIEDLLDAARRKDPRLEPFFAESELEPLFVKNLESVQGDERDLIYFSITYGPDAAGQLAMTFGPLNRLGGERRLNVAVTRARHEMRVFASFRPEQMDLARTPAIGVRDLKHFLEFAERGARALAEATHGSMGGFDSPFEQAVSSALGQRGWRVQSQIGASSFRIDLGIVDPDAPGHYLAGVECDGATYHRSATARDRDKLREKVLRGLGWDIVRVWSTDWWIDPAGTLDKLDAKLQALLTDQRERRAEQAERKAEAERLEHGVVEHASESAKTSDEETEAPIQNVTPALPKTPVSIQSQQAEEVFASQTFAIPAAEKALPEDLSYQVTNPAEAVAGVNPDRFFDGDYNDTLSAMIAHVIDHEGPVLDALLARRIARAHGWLRTGGRIRERVFELARVRYRTTDEDVGTFYWPEHLSPAEEPPFREPTDEDSVRAADEISLPELTSLARAVIAKGTGGEEVYRAMARKLGLQQLRAASRARLESAVRPLSSESGN